MIHLIHDNAGILAALGYMALGALALAIRDHLKYSRKP